MDNGLAGNGMAAEVWQQRGENVIYLVREVER